MRRAEMWRTACVASRRLSALLADNIGARVIPSMLPSGKEYDQHIKGIANHLLEEITRSQIHPYPKQIEHEFLDEIVRQIRSADGW